MSVAEELVASIRRAGADLYVSEGHIRLEGPRRVLTAERQSLIAAHREEVLAFLVAETDAAALERLDATLGNDGAEPDDPLVPRPVAEDLDPDRDLDLLVANVLALSPEDRAAWRLEIVHAAVWAAAGKRDDPHLLADLRVLRRVEAAGACLRCGAACPADGRCWCAGCQGRYTKATEGSQ